MSKLQQLTKTLSEYRPNDKVLEKMSVLDGVSQKKLAGAGALAGLGLATVNGKDDGVSGTGMLMATGAGAALGSQKLYDHWKQDRPSITQKDVSTQAVLGQTDGHFEKQKLKMREMSIGRKLGLAGALAVGTIGAASFIDTGNALEEKKAVSRMTEEQERNLNRQMTQQKRQYSSMGYGHIDMGEMLFEMFDQAIGHHKMGSAKY